MINYDIIIYSKNRPSQLDLLLRSINKYCFGIGKVFVLNDFSGPFKPAYEKIWNKNYNLNIEFKLQTRKTFYSVMKNTIDNINSQYVLPLCDDDVFIRPLDISNDVQFYDSSITGICLRRSLDMKESYHTGQIVDLPDFVQQGNTFKWEWSLYDQIRWGYPYQAGGMVYKKENFKYMIDNISFDLPNYLEYQMVVNKNKWGKTHILCYEKSPIINISVNRVQNDVPNRGGRDVSYSPEQLLKLFMADKIIDLEPLHNFNNTCEFIETQLSFIGGS